MNPVTEPTEAVDAPLGDDDIEIMTDFVMESLENLEKIEIGLIDLEQDPENKDTINDIFRPFHTIKGVSGFLNLSKMNRLSHCTENLLDSARNGEFVISEEITDVILESVDLLTKMIKHLEGILISKSNDLEGDIDIEPLIKKIEKVSQRAMTGESKPLGEILVDSGAIKLEDLQKGLDKQREQPGAKLGNILMDEKIAEPKKVMAALRDQKKNKRFADLQVKVDTQKLDNLIDLTGELVITQSILKQNDHVQASQDTKLNQSMGQLTKIVSDLQKTAMSMRMVPIKNTFQKMVRLVRDLARMSGKKVDLDMSGEDTEIDRNVVEQLYEPLVHMIRNSVDHGLEKPEDRLAVGKDQMGSIQLKAFHKGGNIVIEISDDGKGLDKERIIEKALANNLITEEQTLSDPEIFNLIFQPGFSTAKEITDVSGRGVGMDVVKKGIEKLRGQVEIKSTPGKGSTFFISLPLTLAIIEGMVVRVGDERYIIPTMTIVESVRPREKEYYTVQGQGEMIKFRGTLIPILRLHELFNVAGDTQIPSKGIVVAVEYKNQKRGLLLDELLGKEEIVIKSLGETFKNTKGIAGGAILGDGRIGLILDMEGLFDIASAA
ncbi:chemotaxis protein CheA [Desulfobacterales bacterium HSG17]|nr:chemotaxis protein CheA [Desulfobacterales bacterium HSG17]